MLVTLAPAQAAQVAPMPATFAPSFSDNGKAIVWEQRVQVGAETIALRAGLRYGVADPFHTRDEALPIMRATAWQLLECAHLGWADKLKPFRRDRHVASGRTLKIPEWTPTPEEIAADGGR